MTILEIFFNSNTTFNCKQSYWKKIKDAGEKLQNFFDKFHYVLLLPIQYIQARLHHKTKIKKNFHLWYTSCKRTYVYT